MENNLIEILGCNEPNVIIRKNDNEIRERLNSVCGICHNPLDDIDEDEYPWIICNYGMWMNVRPCYDYSDIDNVREYWNDENTIDCGSDENKFFEIIENFYNKR